MSRPDPTMTPRIVICESEEYTPRGSVSIPHEISAQCAHPRTVKAPEKREAR